MRTEQKTYDGVSRLSRENCLDTFHRGVLPFGAMRRKAAGVAKLAYALESGM